MTTSPEAARPAAAMLPSRIAAKLPTQLPPLGAQAPTKPATRPLIAVSVGTDHHPFERLIGWVDNFAKRHPEIDVVIQYGSAGAPTFARSVQYLSHTELVHIFDRAAVVISHGGPATISEAWRAGMIPVVAPRGSRLGEHVDDHQQAFVAVLASRGQVVHVRTEQELDAAVMHALADPTWLHRESGHEFDIRRSVANVAEIVDQVTARAAGRRRLFRQRKVAQGRTR